MKLGRWLKLVVTESCQSLEDIRVSAIEEIMEGKLIGWEINSAWKSMPPNLKSLLESWVSS